MQTLMCEDCSHTLVIIMNHDSQIDLHALIMHLGNCVFSYIARFFIEKILGAGLITLLCIGEGLKNRFLNHITFNLGV